VTANIQIAIAALAALTVAARCVLAERWRRLARAAGISLVLTLPTFFIYATSYTAGQTQQRALRLSGLITALGLLVAASIVVYLMRTEHKLADQIAKMFFAAVTVISAVAVVAGLIEGYWWYPFVGGYVGHITLAGTLAIGIVRQY